MNTPSQAPAVAAPAAGEIARLEALVGALRAEIATLNDDLAVAECRLGSAESALLREVNERLVLAALLAAAESRLGSAESALLIEVNERLVEAALRAREEADTAAGELEALSETARHDALTGLPNRALLAEELSWAMVFSRRRNSRLGLLFIDLNGFKDINDTLGHAVGDEVLKRVAERLSNCVRETDTVSRHGGDEFLVLLSEISNAADAARVAEKMVSALAAPCRVGDHVLRLSASIGVSVYPDDGTEAQQLIDKADAAMYRAKSEGRGSFVFRGAGVAAELLVSQPSFASLRRPLARHEAAVSEHEQRLAEMQEANEALVLAALDAQERQAAAETAQRKQREFMAMLAHELRNPLGPIRNAAAAMTVADSTQPLLPKMHAIIERQVAQMTRLVEDLLDVSRIENGKLRLERMPVDIVALVDAAVEAARPAMDARMQTFQTQMPAGGLGIEGDPVRLVQVFSNVLNNASKYTPHGGAIDLGIEAAGGDVVVTIADTGIGIPADSLTTIFEPFTQGAEAVGSHNGGLGIGLTVVRQLVEAHGGRVHAESAGRGAGSRFVIRLPRAAPDAAA